MWLDKTVIILQDFNPNKTSFQSISFIGMLVARAFYAQVLQPREKSVI